MTHQQWALEELKTRRWEVSNPDVHVARRKRRQAVGLTKKAADDLLEWADNQGRPS